MAIQSDYGKIGFDEDFLGIAATFSVADATAGTRLNDITIVAISGQSEIDWIVTETGGVITVNGAGGAADGVAFLSSPMSPGVNGTMVVEARFQNSSAADFRAFLGWQETASLSETVNPYTLSGTTLTANAAGEVVGFYFDAAATTDDFRFMAGANSSASTAAALDYALGGATTLGALGVRCNATVTADKFMVGRVEIDPDGTARGYFGDETMAKTTGLTHIATLRAGELSTTALYHPVLILVATSTGDPTGRVDYFRGKGNRDWSA